MNIFIALALLLVPVTPASHSAAPAAAAAPRTATVIVKIGEASLEEYRHGDPADRVQLGCGSQSAKKLQTHSL